MSGGGEAAGAARRHRLLDPYRPLCVLAATALLASCATAPRPRRSARPATGVVWRVRFGAPGADPEVTLTTPCVRGRPPALRIATHLGHLHPLAVSFVTDLHAFADGRPVTVHTPAPGTFTADATGCRTLRVRYRLALHGPALPRAPGDTRPAGLLGELPFTAPTGALLLGTVNLLAPADGRVGPARLLVWAPPGWYVVGPWRRAPDGGFVGPDARTLVHGFVGVEPRAPTHVSAGGSEATVVTLLAGNPAVDARLTAALKRLLEVEARLFDAGDAWHGVVLIEIGFPKERLDAWVAGQSLVLDVPRDHDKRFDSWAADFAADYVARTWRCAKSPTPVPADLEWDYLGVDSYLGSTAFAEMQDEDAPPIGPGIDEALRNAAAVRAKTHGMSVLEAGPASGTNEAAWTLSAAGGVALAFRLDRLLQKTGGGRSLVGFLRRFRNHWCRAHPSFGLADFLAQLRAYGGDAVAHDLDANLHARGFPNPATLLRGTGCVGHLNQTVPGHPGMSISSLKCDGYAPDEAPPAHP